jgi:hypothetical protein
LWPPPPPDEAPRRAALLGRAINGTYVYDRPSLKGKPLRLRPAEAVFDIYETVQSDDAHYNRTWYRVAGGFMYSGTVQPAQWRIQQPSLEVPKGGFLGEISVPYTLAKNYPKATAPTTYRLYYETTYWITEAKADDTGNIWYKITDDRYETVTYWAPGRHVRRITASEIAPLTPNVANKRIEIALDAQTARCYEGDKLMLETLCATGPYLRMENGERFFSTPRGNWMVDRKRPSRHMAADDLAAGDGFDLPGVPWVSYFHWWGVSFHGTYWHNDFGRARSHGCINVPSATAKWLYRWAAPHGDDLTHIPEEIKGDGGTPVLVAY